MRLSKWIAVTLTVFGLALGSSAVTASAAEWSWANYGFSGTAIANPDAFDKTSYLIGGYVATVNHKNPLPSSYVYRSRIIVDTEEVAIRFRFSWENTESGYKAVADLANGVAVYPMDESIDISVVTDNGTERFSFPVPGAYDYLKANEFCIMDDGSAMTVSVCGREIASLRFSGTRKVENNTCFASVTVTDGNGYVYARLSDTRVLSEGGYVGYSSSRDRTLILVKEHSMEEADITLDALPEEKETVEGWVPETEAKATEPLTEPETEPQTDPGTEPAAESTTSPVTDTPTESDTETVPAETGCASAAGAGACLVATTAALVLGKKKD